MTNRIKAILMVILVYCLFAAIFAAMVFIPVMILIIFGIMCISMAGWLMYNSFKAYFDREF